MLLKDHKTIQQSHHKQTKEHANFRGALQGLFEHGLKQTPNTSHVCERIGKFDLYSGTDHAEYETETLLRKKREEIEIALNEAFIETKFLDGQLTGDQKNAIAQMRKTGSALLQVILARGLAAVDAAATAYPGGSQPGKNGPPMH